MIQLRIKSYSPEERELLYTLFTDMSEHCTNSIYANWYSAKAKRRVLKDILDVIVYLDKLTNED